MLRTYVMQSKCKFTSLESQTILGILLTLKIPNLQNTVLWNILRQPLSAACPRLGIHSYGLSVYQVTGISSLFLINSELSLSRWKRLLESSMHKAQAQCVSFAARIREEGAGFQIQSSFLNFVILYAVLWTLLNSSISAFIILNIFDSITDTCTDLLFCPSCPGYSQSMKS